MTATTSTRATRRSRWAWLSFGITLAALAAAPGVRAQDLPAVQGAPKVEPGYPAFYGISPLRPAKAVLPCREGESLFCFQDRRFEVQVEWFLETGESGSARRVPRDLPSEDSGLFYFFAPENWELVLKVLDGCAFNDRFWVFASAASDVGYTIRVLDTEAALERTYTKPAGVVAPSLTDTFALPTCDVFGTPVPTVDLTPDEFVLFAGESTGIDLLALDEEGAPASGRRVELSADFGSVDPAELVVDSRGGARFFYRADDLGGRAAVVTARLVDGEGLAAVDRLELAVLSRPAALALVSSVTIIPAGEVSTVILWASVFDGAGQRLPGWPVTFSSEVGEFSDGEVQVTNSEGVAAAALTVDSQFLDESFEITATVDGIDGPLVDRVIVTVFGI
ncbi:MAG: hypothetical protein AAGM22_14480 [Acidobacteriota bacterium]